ncbi:MAG: DNA repair protein RecN [Thermoleophilia bacterium]
MLSELYIENLAVIPAASLRLSPGLNVITGETGAGKTILAHAIALLLGSRADTSMIRPGADEAVVEAVFEVGDSGLDALGAQIDLVPGEPLAVRRRLARDGRSRAYIGGRVTSVSMLQQLTARLLAFSAQHEQRGLMMAGRQLEILDSFAGDELSALLDEYAILYGQALEKAALLESIDRDSESNRREAELLGFQVAEIEAAGITPAEDSELEAERQRLLNAGSLKSATGALGRSLVLGDSGESIKDALANLLPELQEHEKIDERVASIAARLQDCVFELEDLGREAIEYSEGVVDDPGRLREVEERLDLLGDLKRKYGSSLDEVLAYLATASDNLKALGGAERDEGALRRELEAMESELVQLALKMRQVREAAALRLGEATAGHLAELAFKDCGFSVELERCEGDSPLTAERLTPHGAETVEFFVRLNAGMPAAPLRSTASGGELSRIMLAVKSALSTGDDSATLVFDEIDAGIGGETGSAVGLKLKSLSHGSQVICITHLPQIACFADTHFSVVKDGTGAGGMTETEVRQVAGEEAVDELCRMMGSDPADARARAHVESLRDRAASC